MRKIALFLPILLSVGLANALTLNAQNTTTCNFNACETIIDLTKYFNQAQINTIKSLNYTLPKISNMVSKVEINNNTLRIYGSIMPYTSNYWNLAVSTLNIDPWWNYTSYSLSNDNVWVNADVLGGASADGSNDFGVKFKTLNNQTKFIGARYQSNPYTVTQIVAQDGSTVICSNTSGSGLWANFSNCMLNASTNYTIVGVHPGTRIYKDPGTYPQNSVDISVIAGMSSGRPFGAGNTLIFEFDRLVTQSNFSTNYSTYYDIHLAINNAEANITTACSWEPHNYTAWTNLTGLPISIMYNNTLFGTNTTRYETHPGLIAGYWNITANASNSSTSAMTWLIHNITLGNVSSNVSLTFDGSHNGTNTTCLDTNVVINCSSWALEDGVALWNNTSYVGFSYNFITNTPGVVMFNCSWNASDCYYAGYQSRYLTVSNCSVNYLNSNSTYSMCSNNDTLYTHSVKIENGLYNTTESYEYCWWRCDNITRNCNPPEYVQSIYIYGLILLAGIIIVWVFR